MRRRSRKSEIPSSKSETNPKIEMRKSKNWMLSDKAWLLSTGFTEQAAGRGEGLLQLQPGEAAAARRVGTGGELDDQSFIIARACGSEGGFESGDGIGAGDLCEPNAGGKRLERIESGAALCERLGEKTFAIAPEQVEDDKL